jgi:hypothetical protein
MRTYENRTVETPIRHLAELKCDVCGVIGRNGKWEKHSYSILETEIKMVDGVGSPDGGASTETSFDICPDCFKSKLVPWFESFGARPSVEKVDW